MLLSPVLLGIERWISMYTKIIVKHSVNILIYK